MDDNKQQKTFTEPTQSNSAILLGTITTKVTTSPKTRPRKLKRRKPASESPYRKKSTPKVSLSTTPLTNTVYYPDITQVSLKRNNTNVLTADIPIMSSGNIPGNDIDLQPTGPNLDDSILPKPSRRPNHPCAETLLNLAHDHAAYNKYKYPIINNPIQNPMTDIDDSNLFPNKQTSVDFFIETSNNTDALCSTLLNDTRFKELITKYEKENLSLILNTHQETMCRLVALGHSLANACIICGYSDSNIADTVRRLYRSPIIHARVKQILDGDYRGIEISRELILLKLQYIEQRALKSDRLKEALEAVKLIGQDIGMFGAKGKDAGDSKGITIIIHDTYSTDIETGKRMISKRRIKDPVNMVKRVDEAEPTEVIEDISSGSQDNDVNPKNCLAHYFTD